MKHDIIHNITHLRLLLNRNVLLEYPKLLFEYKLKTKYTITKVEIYLFNKNFVTASTTELFYY